MHRALDRARLLHENQRYREKLESANRELEASLHLLQEDQNAGRQVQMNMLPVSPWTTDEFSFAHKTTLHGEWFNLFDTIVTADDPEVGAAKPAPDIFLTAARRLLFARLHVPP